LVQTTASFSIIKYLNIINRNIFKKIPRVQVSLYVDAIEYVHSYTAFNYVSDRLIFYIRYIQNTQLNGGINLKFDTSNHIKCGQSVAAKCIPNSIYQEAVRKIR